MKQELEIKRAEVELMRVRSARHDQELKIMEREEEISRIQEHLKIQLEKENELDAKLKSLKGE